MKFALLTSQVIVPIEDEEEATELAVQTNEAVRLNIESAVARHGATVDDLAAEGFRNLGTSVSIWEQP